MTTTTRQCSSGGTSSLLSTLGLCEEKVAEKVAEVLSENPTLIAAFIKRQWPKIDRYVWLYMFFSVVAIGICSFCIFSLVCILQWVYRRVPPVKEWIQKLRDAIGEMKSAVNSAADETIITSSDALKGAAVTAAEGVKGCSLRGSFEDNVDALVDAFQTVEQKWGMPIK